MSASPCIKDGADGAANLSTCLITAQIKTLKLKLAAVNFRRDWSQTDDQTDQKAMVAEFIGETLQVS